MFILRQKKEFDFSSFFLLHKKVLLHPYSQTEEEGFEPSVATSYNGFQNRHIRPLCHPSLALVLDSFLDDFSFAEFFDTI